MDRAIYYAKEFMERMKNDDYFGLSAQLAYFFLLSLFPLLLFSITLIGYLPLDEEVIFSLLSTVAPAETMEFITSNTSEIINEQKGGLLSFGIIGTLWSASNGVNAIMKALNRAYKVKESRPFLMGRLIAIILTISMIGVIVIAILLPVLGRAIGVYVFSLIGLSDDFIQLWEALRWTISSMVFFIVFLFLYKLAPNHKVYFRQAAIGAAFSTICWQLVSFGFSYYVEVIGNFSATYGSLGAVIVLMIWFYLSGFIIIIGGVINAVIEDYNMIKVG